MRKIFELHGTVGVDGLEGVKKSFDAIDKQLTVVAKNLKKTGENFEKVGGFLTKTITAPLLAVGATLGVAITKTAEYADKILDLQEVTGLSTDSLQKWRYAIEAGGGDFDSFISIISKFTNKIPDLLKGNNDAAKTFKQLGVSLLDANGNVRDMNVLFPEIINKLQGIENVTVRNTVAQDLFGKSLDELAPVLGTSAGELQNLFNKAEQVGVVMSEDDLQAADKLGQQVRELKVQFEAATAQIAVEFLPIAEDLFKIVQEQGIPFLKDFADKVKDLFDWFDKLDEPTKKFYENVFKIAGILAISGPLLVGLGSVLKTAAELRVVMVALNAAMLANPWLVVAAAVAAFGVGLYLTKDNMKKLNDEMQLKNADRTKAMLEELRSELVKLDDQMGMTEQGMSYFMGTDEDYKEITGNIKTIETNLADLGVKIEGDVISKLQQVKRLLGEATGESKTETTKKTTVNINDRTDEELQQYANKLEEEIKLEKSYADTMAKIDSDLQEEKKQAYEDMKKASIEWDNEQAQNIKEKNTQEFQDKEAQWKAIDEQIEKEKEQRLNAYNAIVDAVLQLGSIISMYYENEEISIDNNYEKEKERIESLNIAENEKHKMIEDLDSTTAKKKKELQRKAAIIEKAIAIFQIGINTAQGIMNAWATLPYYMAIAMSIIIGALGAVQTAVVAAKPLPAAAGAFVESDPGKGAIMQVGEGSQDEIVMPLDTGIKAMVDQLIKEVNSQPIKTVNNTQNLRPITLNIGTLIADENGLKELERRMSRIKVVEAQRMGAMS